MDDDRTHGPLTERTIDLVACDERYAVFNHFKQIIVDASVDEDRGARMMNHFYDADKKGLPINTVTEFMALLLESAAGLKLKPNPTDVWDRSGSDIGTLLMAPAAMMLRTRFPSALDWGRNGTPDDLDWEGAIEAYDYSAESRERAFRALAHVLHLVQDMAQPDHASARPHPGGYVKGILVAGLAKIGVEASNKSVSYEGLWALVSPEDVSQWPLGSMPKKLVTLEQAFDELSAASREAESELGLPVGKRSDKSLGEAVFSTLGLPLGEPVDESLGEAKCSTLGLMALLSGAVVGRAAPRAVQGDAHWLKYEASLPLISTIPPPPGNWRTAAHLLLGKQLMPLAEEYGAGLLMFFQDVVNPPPYVETVEIMQDKKSRYRKTWFEHIGSERLLRRELKTIIDEPLDIGVPAQVRFLCGPRMTLGGEDASKSVHVLKVSVESESGAYLVPGGPQASDPAGGGAGLNELWWTGHFTPRADGTLVIEARDVTPHFTGRSDAGDVLDSDPAAPARVTSKAPYEWDNYRPGPDRNHSFRVKKGCMLESLRDYRWGTWTGTIEWVREGDEEIEELLVEDFTFRSCEDGLSAYFGGRGGSVTHRKRTKPGNVEVPVDESDEPEELRMSGEVRLHGSNGGDGRFEFGCGHFTLELEENFCPAGVRVLRGERETDERGLPQKCVWQFNYGDVEPPPHASLDAELATHADANAHTDTAGLVYAFMRRCYDDFVGPAVARAARTTRPIVGPPKHWAGVEWHLLSERLVKPLLDPLQA